MFLKLIALCFGFLLTACGFQPLYMRSGDVLEQTASVQIEPISGDGGYQMGLILQDRLNPKQASVFKKYRLLVELSQPRLINQSIRSDNFASLEKMSIKASYQLIDIKENKILISTTIDANGLFNLIKDPYATTVAQENLYQNLVKVLAEDISMHVLAYFKGQSE